MLMIGEVVLGQRPGSTLRSGQGLGSDKEFVFCLSYVASSDCLFPDQDIHYSDKV